MRRRVNRSRVGCTQPTISRCASEWWVEYDPPYGRCASDWWVEYDPPYAARCVTEGGGSSFVGWVVLNPPFLVARRSGGSSTTHPTRLVTRWRMVGRVRPTLRGSTHHFSLRVGVVGRVRPTLRGSLRDGGWWVEYDPPLHFRRGRKNTSARPRMGRAKARSCVRWLPTGQYLLPVRRHRALEAARTACFWRRCTRRSDPPKNGYKLQY